MLSIIYKDEQILGHTSPTRNQDQITKRRKKNTLTKPFEFKTDTRIRNTNSNVLMSETKDFSSQLRQHTAVQSSTSATTTKVKPFNLTLAKKRKATDFHFLSLAEQINVFHQKTPDRYHTTSQKEFQPQEHWFPPKLRPRTPNLQAVKRRRVVHAISREEQEAKELEEIKAYSFHARPVDPRIYNPVSLEDVEVKPTTKTIDVKLKTAQRTRVFSDITNAKAYKFQARPAPKHIWSGPTGLGEKPEIAKTKPKSPSFTTEKRLQKRKLLEKQRKLKKQPAKKPKTVKRKPDTPKEVVKLTRTEIKPFSFDKVDQERYYLKEKKIKEEIEKESKPFVFKAQLLPSSEVSSLPEVKKKSKTRAKPFNFCLDKRKLRSSFSIMDKSVSFKAQPATVLYQAPFIPQKPSKPTIDTREFDLYTNKRASERLKLHEIRKAEEQVKEQLLLAQKAKEEKRVKEEIQKLRQDLVHKANPIMQCNPLVVKPSSRPLTIPKTPEFQTEKRLKSWWAK